jgi:hypothetical protein
MWPTTGSRYIPGAGCQPKRGNLLSTVCLLVWTVVVGKLDVLVEHLPTLVPAPQGYAVNTALASGDTQWNLLLDHKPDGLCSRFW